MHSKIKYAFIGIGYSIAFFFLFGIPTAVISNPWFIRMIENNTLDYVFLILSSVLLGAYVGVHYYKKNKSHSCGISTYAGGVGSFLAFGCPVCNKVLVFLFGTTTLMVYFEPYRPVLGVVSSTLLVGALYFRIKE